MTPAEVGADAWDGLLDRIGCFDAYFRRGYVEASCLLDGGRPVLLHHAGEGGDVVLAVSVREVPGGDGLLDATTPYGYGGPVAAGPEPPGAEFWDAYGAWCRERGVVSTFLRFHPLLRNRELAPSGARVEPLADTIAWRLDGDGDLAAGMHRHHRRVVRRARDRVTVSVDEAPARLDDFALLYEAAMRRRGADAFYFFPPAYWEALAGESLVRVDAALDGEVVASVLCLATPPWLHYHLGGSLDAARSVGASAHCLLGAARWGREHGYEILHLGGGVGGSDDSLRGWKRRFAPGGEVEAWIGKLVHDEDAYRALAGLEGPLELAGFFPAYRRPVSGTVGRR